MEEIIGGRTCMEGIIMEEGRHALAWRRNCTLINRD